MYSIFPIETLPVIDSLVTHPWLIPNTRPSCYLLSETQGANQPLSCCCKGASHFYQPLLRENISGRDVINTRKLKYDTNEVVFGFSGVFHFIMQRDSHQRLTPSEILQFFVFILKHSKEITCFYHLFTVFFLEMARAVLPQLFSLKFERSSH